MLVLKYHLTEEEYFDYNYYTAWSSPEKKGYRIRYYLRVFLLYTAVAVLFIISRQSRQLLIDFTIFGIIAITYFYWYPGSSKLYSPAGKRHPAPTRKPACTGSSRSNFNGYGRDRQR
ncbi:hypothetical protein [Paraflavitalea speifideaquila]|uniref:hypothetical protein n=1 Tax=Paraflavitalea speifideaquila TaxID=3076558 RepID=UPI0028E4DA08|nr:hypothetical protein [Paraflavitalea speifideiaquila]